MASANVDIIFRGIDQVGGTVKGIKNDISSLSSNLQSAAGPIASTTTGLIAAGAAASATAVAFGAFAASTSLEFETAFSEIATVVGKPKEALEGFRRR